MGDIMLGFGAMEFGDWFKRPRQTVPTRKAAAGSSITIGEIKEVVSEEWWSLNRGLRSVLVIVAVWIASAYLFQDDYDKNLKIIFLPAMGLLALYFGHRFLVNDKPA